MLNIEIIKIKIYYRHHTAVTDFAFTPSSPAIQNIHTAMLYPGMGLLEAVNINEGRGTPFPFQQLGAPWINAEILCNSLTQLKRNGIIFHPVSFKASAPPYNNELCNGVLIQVTDAQQLMAVETGIRIVQTIAALYPQHLQERLYQTNANPSGTNHLEKLLGIKNAWQVITQQQHFNTNCAADWYHQIKSFLLYKEDENL
jgi:uncharacterized protein YbbC (DUF1343 family)